MQGFIINLIRVVFLNTWKLIWENTDLCLGESLSVAT